MKAITVRVSFDVLVPFNGAETAEQVVEDLTVEESQDYDQVELHRGAYDAEGNRCSLSCSAYMTDVENVQVQVLGETEMEED